MRKKEEVEEKERDEKLARSMKWENIRRSKEDRAIELKNLVMRKCRIVNWRSRIVLA